MKKISTALITLCLMLLISVTAYAETSVTITPSDPEAASDAVTIVDWSVTDAERSNEIKETYDTGTGGYTAVPVRDAAPADSIFYPINVETVTENGVTFVKKTYEVAPDVDPQMLVQPFEQYGHRFIGREILRRQLPGETQTRAVSKTAILDSDSDDKADILKQFPATIDHEENGYAGELHLDVSTIVTEAENFETYTYSYTKAREIPALDRNDPAYLDKQWNGMVLGNASFIQDAGGRYTATAVYTGTATGKRPTSYVTTASYCGEITKTEPGNIQYTVIYEGVPIEIPAETEKQPEPEVPLQATEPGQDAPALEIAEQAKGESPSNSGFTLFHIALTGLAGILLGGVVIRKIEPLLKNLFHKKREEYEE